MIIRTPDQRLRVFVSSTLQELVDERAAAREAINRLLLAPVMFETGARPHPPRDLYRAYLDQSHIFIGLYWERYGWVAPDMNISGLEDEWQLSGDRPKLIYVKAPAPNREPRLKTMLEQIRESGNASYKPFSTAAELQQLIENDLAILLTERFEMTQPAPARSSQPARATNLPTPATPLIGRERDVEQVSKLLLREETRLVTLYGPGGIGKTRLAIEVGQRVAGHFEHGVCLVPLGTITDHNLVVPAIGEALGKGETRSAGLAERVTETLHDRQMLLILDNFEQVLSAASQVAELLNDAPRLEMIVTSRAVLRVRGEYEFSVPTLALPSARDTTDLIRLRESSAVQLFVSSATAVKSEFELTAENAQAVAEICERLDGLPLAIELAAARAKMLSPQAILARLIDAGQQARLLSGGARDLPARQQTLKNTLDWSLSLIDLREQILFARLSVFVDGWTLDAVTDVCGHDYDELDVMDVMASLADKSLIRPMSNSGDAVRFTMLNIIRDYAATRLAESGDQDAVRQNHASHFAALAERADPELRHATQQDWLMRLDRENANLQAALGWLIDNGQSEAAAQMGWTLRIYWLIAARLSEGLRWMISTLSRLDVTPTSPEPMVEARAKALAVAGLSTAWQGNPEWAAFLLAEAESLTDRLGAKSTDIAALVNGALGITAEYLPDHDQATARFETSLQQFRSIGDAWGAAMVLSGIERMQTHRGDYAAAKRTHDEIEALAQTLGDGVSAALATFELGRVALIQGDAAQAGERFRESVRWSQHAGYHEGIARGLEWLAAVANTYNEPERAAQLFGAAYTIREDRGLLAWRVETPQREQVLRNIREQAGPAFDAAWAHGTTMSTDEAIAFALEAGEKTGANS